MTKRTQRQDASSKFHLPRPQELLLLLLIALFGVSHGFQSVRLIPPPTTERSAVRSRQTLFLVPPTSENNSIHAKRGSWETAATGTIKTPCDTLLYSTTEPLERTKELVGDDSAYFDIRQQKLGDWIKFSAATGFVLAAISYLWFLPPGPHLGDSFLQAIQSAIHTTDPAWTIFTMLSVFAVAHSGLAGLRTYAEPVVGARAWRVLFAVVSLPLALSCISYFVNHAHDGAQLWDITPYDQQTGGLLHAIFWITNFVSFIFLYPSTFNLLEIAAIERPQLHLWETGIIRITRHPQAVGQIMWCMAHTAWLGTSTAAAASSILIAHHVFSMYHGDRRLRTRHGEAFDDVKSRTSLVPFQAILEGRQELPPDYYKEFLRGPYALVVGGTVAAYFAHPWMQAGAALLHW